jgi:hypothetical protein
MIFKRFKPAFFAIATLAFLAALLAGCMQEKQASEEPTPPPLPNDELTSGQNAEPNATLEAGGGASGGNDDSPPPLPG